MKVNCGWAINGAKAPNPEHNGFIVFLAQTVITSQDSESITDTDILENRSNFHNAVLFQLKSLEQSLELSSSRQHSK